MLLQHRIGFTWFDVIQVDLNELVTIRSALLVPSAESVEDLVNDNALDRAALTDWDVLRSANLADIGITSEKRRMQEADDCDINSELTQTSSLA